MSPENSTLLIMSLYSFQGDALSKSLIAPLPEMVKIPSLDKIHVRPAPQVPEVPSKVDDELSA